VLGFPWLASLHSLAPLVQPRLAVMFRDL